MRTSRMWRRSSSPGLEPKAPHLLARALELPVGVVIVFVLLILLLMLPLLLLLLRPRRPGVSNMLFQPPRGHVQPPQATTPGRATH